MSSLNQTHFQNRINRIKFILYSGQVILKLKKIHLKLVTKLENIWYT